VDEQGRSEVGDDLGALFFLQELVEGSHGGAEPPARDERDGKGPVVSDRERDAVAGLHAAGGERLRDRAHPVIQRAEGRGGEGSVSRTALPRCSSSQNVKAPASQTSAGFSGVRREVASRRRAKFSA